MVYQPPVSETNKNQNDAEDGASTPVANKTDGSRSPVNAFGFLSKRGSAPCRAQHEASVVKFNPGPGPSC